MYERKATARRFFDAPRRADHRPNAPDPDRVLPFRDRVALGYYDRPDLAEAAVVRMLQILIAENN